MRRPGLSLRGLAGATLAVAAFACAAVFPVALGELPGRLASAPAGEPGPAGLVERLDAAFLARLLPVDHGERRLLARTIVAEAEAARIDPLLVLALIEVESGWDPAALSGRGARGLMQLREPTMRRELERAGLDLEDPHDPVANVQVGVRYLRRLLDAFGREELALMAYNAGPNRVLGFIREGEIPERFHVYPRRVKAELRRLRRAMDDEARPVLAEARLPAAPQ